ncbi:uncharacterized protein LOC125039703 [Penaeus chinensis]|uniref:uncharacterized protein LOC125039703 n=1 Tax=Penaeus chinensis TaxID=139456 RepID=UPI001FB80DCE|nr:uncharacterized protein LOC125039703 [Penaeus chinensis]
MVSRQIPTELGQDPLVKSILKRARGNFAACERAPIETENRIARSTLASACQLSSQTNAKTTNTPSFNFRSRRPQTPKVKWNTEVISHPVFVKIKVLCPSAKRNIRTTKSALQGYVKNSSVPRESADRATTAASHNESLEPLTTTNREINKIKGTGRQGPLSRPLQLPYARLIRHSFSSPEKIPDFLKRECALGKGSSFHRETTSLSTPLDQDTSETGVKKKRSLSRPIQQPFVRLIRHSFSSPEEIRDFVKSECALVKGSSLHRETTPLSTPLDQSTSEMGVTIKRSLNYPIQQPLVRLIRPSFSSPEEIRDFVKRECALAKNSS